MECKSRMFWRMRYSRFWPALIVALVASISGGSVPTSWEGWPIDGANYFSMQHAFREHEYFAQLVNALNERAAAVHEVWTNTDYSVKIIKTGMVGEAGDEREVGFTNQFGEIDCGGGDTAYFEVTRDDMIDLITGIVSLFEGVQWVRHDLSDDGRWGVLDYWFDGYTKGNDLYHWPQESLRTALAVLEIGYDVGLLWFWDDEHIYTTGGVVYVMSQPDTASPIEWTLAEKQSWAPGYVGAEFSGGDLASYNKTYVPNTAGRPFPSTAWIDGTTGTVYVSTSPDSEGYYSFLVTSSGGMVPSGRIALYNGYVGLVLCNSNNDYVSAEWFSVEVGTSNAVSGYTTNNTTAVWRDDTHVVGTFAHKALPGSVPKVKAKPSFFGNVTLHGTVWTNSPEADGLHAVFFGSEETVSIGGTEANCAKYWYSVTNMVITADPPNDTTTIYVAWDYSGAFYSQMLGENDYLTGLHWPDVLNDAQKVIDRMRWFVGEEGEWANAAWKTQSEFKTSSDFLGIDYGISTIASYYDSFTFPTGENVEAIMSDLVNGAWANAARFENSDAIPSTNSFYVDFPLMDHNASALSAGGWTSYATNDAGFNSPPHFSWSCYTDGYIDGAKYWYVLPADASSIFYVDSFNVTGFWNSTVYAGEELTIVKSDYRVRAPTNSHIELYGYSYISDGPPTFAPAYPQTSIIHAIFVDDLQGTSSVRECKDVTITNLGDWVDFDSRIWGSSPSVDNSWPSWHPNYEQRIVEVDAEGYWTYVESVNEMVAWIYSVCGGSNLVAESYDVFFGGYWFDVMLSCTNSFEQPPFGATYEELLGSSFSGMDGGDSTMHRSINGGESSSSTLTLKPLIKLDVSGGLKYVD